MSLESRGPIEPETGLKVGNIYDRLRAARQRRERILEPPRPANDDRKVKKVHPVGRSFPALKPPAKDIPTEPELRRWDRAVPWLLGLLIFAVIFVFAVG